MDMNDMVQGTEINSKREHCAIYSDSQKVVSFDAEGNIIAIYDVEEEVLKVPAYKPSAGAWLVTTVAQACFIIAMGACTIKFVNWLF